MKKEQFGLGYVASIFCSIYYGQRHIAVSSFYMAAAAMAMFAVLGPFGDYFRQVYLW
jgi:hypothetical protein